MDFLPTENTNYAGNYKVFSGLWPRALAVIIDVIMLAPMVLFCYVIFNSSITAALFGLVVVIILAFGYAVYFNFSYGATIGKMVLKIKVTNPDGSSISLKQAVLRLSVDMAFVALFMTALFIALSDASPQAYVAVDWMERLGYLIPLYPSWYDLVASRYLIWLFSEAFFLLINKRKRAIHDFIAGTVVINREFAGKNGKPGHLI